MRILLTTDAAGGVWRYSATLARALLARGHELLLAVIGNPIEEQLEELPSGIEIELRDFRLEWEPGAEDDLSPTACWLLDLERRWNPDLLHLNQMTYTGLVTFGKPTVVVVHSDVCSWFTEVRGATAPVDWLPYRQLVRMGLESASRIVAPSRYQADLVTANYGPLPVTVIYNGVDPAIAGLDSAGEPGDRQVPLLLTVGRAWDDAKGIELLDEALVRLGDRAPGAHLVGALKGPDGAGWRPRRMRVEGHLSALETARWMQSATIYVAPARYEPFGLAPVEAALSGCALLLSDVGSFRELWEGRAEFFVSGSVGALATKIDALCHRPERVAQLAGSARLHALERFSAARFVEDYQALYRDLLRCQRGPARGSFATTSSGWSLE